MPTKRVTVTLPVEMVETIDRLDANRSRFVTEALRIAFEHRRRENLRRSLAEAHPETHEVAEAGFQEWAERLGDSDSERLLDPKAGQGVRWVPGEGWVGDGE